MAKTTKKTSKNLKRKSSKRNDIVLAILLGVAVTGVGLIITRFSSAGSNASFRRDPYTQMQGGIVNTVKKTRVASSPAPGINPVYTLVSATEMGNTAKVCIQYTVLKNGTWINMTYNNAKKEGIATGVGETHNTGIYTYCMDRGAQAVNGTININVSPGSAQINKFYGVLRSFDD